MALHPHSSVTTITTTTTTTAITTTTAATRILFFLRPHFRPPIYTPFRHQHPIRNVSIDAHIQRRRLLLPPPCVFSGDIPGHLLQDAGASLLLVAGAYALVAGFDNLTQRQIVEQVVESSEKELVKTLLTSINTNSKVNKCTHKKRVGAMGVLTTSLKSVEVGKLFSLGVLTTYLSPFFCALTATKMYSFITTFESKQKVGSYIIWIALYGLLANLQISTSTEARYFAALVPLLNCVRLLVHGFSLVTNEDLIKSVTREGKPEELLRGPLYYVLMLILCSIVFWRESPIGVVSLSMMCGGDGIADIIGRRLGIHKIPYNKQKSWIGSISMFIVGFLISLGMMYYFSKFGYFELDRLQTIERVAVVAMVATVVESLPSKGGIDDNISVPLVSMVTAYLSFGFQH